MALGTAVKAVGNPMVNLAAVAPVSMVSSWLTIIDAGGMTVQDNAAITNPTTQITSSTRHILQRKGVGTNLLLRMRYDAGLTAIGNPTVRVFGRTGTQDWELLSTKSAALTASLTTAATDASNGTLKATTPDFSAICWDCLGCDEVIVGIETVLSGTGTKSNAYLEGKFI